MKLTKSQIKQIIKEELEAVREEIAEAELQAEAEAEESTKPKKFTYDREKAVAELNAKFAEPMK